MKKAAFGMLGVVLLLVTPCMSFAQQGEPSKTGVTLSETKSTENLAEVLRSLHGKRERRLFRLQRWAKSLKGDKKRIYETYGFPTGRYREDVMGEVVEKWTYLSKGVEFTFKEGKLIKERHFPPGSP